MINRMNNNKRTSIFVLLGLLCLIMSNWIGVFSLVANNSSRQRQNIQITNQVISRMAEVALKLRLTKQRCVLCIVVRDRC